MWWYVPHVSAHRIYCRSKDHKHLQRGEGEPAGEKEEIIEAEAAGRRVPEANEDSNRDCDRGYAVQNTCTRRKPVTFNGIDVVGCGPALASAGSGSGST